MKKIVILLLFIMALFSFSAQAIEGHVILDYDTISGGGQGEIYLYEPLNDKLRIGGKFKTVLSKYSIKDDWVPAGVPESQTYDLIVEYDMTKKVTLRFITGCNHYFSRSGELAPAWFANNDASYIKVGAKYTF